MKFLASMKQRFSNILINQGVDTVEIILSTASFLVVLALTLFLFAQQTERENYHRHWATEIDSAVKS